MWGQFCCSIKDEIIFHIANIEYTQLCWTTLQSLAKQTMEHE